MQQKWPLTVLEFFGMGNTKLEGIFFFFTNASPKMEAPLQMCALFLAVSPIWCVGLVQSARLMQRTCIFASSAVCESGDLECQEWSEEKMPYLDAVSDSILNFKYF